MRFLVRRMLVVSLLATLAPLVPASPAAAAHPINCRAFWSYDGTAADLVIDDIVYSWDVSFHVTATCDSPVTMTVEAELWNTNRGGTNPYRSRANGEQVVAFTTSATSTGGYSGSPDESFAIRLMFELLIPDGSTWDTAPVGCTGVGTPLLKCDQFAGFVKLPPFGSGRDAGLQLIDPGPRPGPSSDGGSPETFRSAGPIDGQAGSSSFSTGEAVATGR